MPFLSSKKIDFTKPGGLVHGPLDQEKKRNCARLALYAEMMKGKARIPSTLKEVGGTKGVGVMFLAETFSASSASPEHRLHQKAARAVPIAPRSRFTAN